MKGNPVVGACAALVIVVSCGGGGGGGNNTGGGTDNGNSWTKLPGTGISTSRGGAALVELPDGRFGTLGVQNLLLSSDHGASWKATGPALPYPPVGLVYSRFRKAFYVWHFDCNFNPSGDPVPSDAIMQLAFDYQTQ